MAPVTDRWILVVDWRRFQHYDPAKRTPPWIKNYTELMASDEYLALSEHRALMLHRLWLEYASSRCRLRADTRTLSRRLAMRVTMNDLESLSDAGFIAIVASRPLADGSLNGSGALDLTRALARDRDRDRDRELHKDIPL